MEYLISDLLDTLPEVSLEIKPNTTASRTRIKELTIIKIRQARPSHRIGLRPLLIAAIISLLTITVFAASGAADWFLAFFSDNNQTTLSPGQVDFITANTTEETQSQTIGNYTVSLDSFISDGGTVHGKVSIAPTQKSLTSEDFYTFRDWSITSPDNENVCIGLTWGPENLNNGIDPENYLLTFDCFLLKQSPHITVELTDLCNKNGHILERGTWKFSITVTDTAQQLLKEPLSNVTVSDENEAEFTVTLTEVILRPLSVYVSYKPAQTEHTYFIGSARAILHDGTVIDLLPSVQGRESDEPDSAFYVVYYGGLLAQEEIDCIELPGDIRLPVNN